MVKLKEWVVLAALGSLWACGSPEQATVDQFFRAANDNDSVTVASMAAVGPPAQVESWKAVEVTSRTTEPYGLPDLLEEFKKAEAERNEGLDERKKYFEAHQDALEQIIPKLQEDPDYKFKGDLAEIQAEWERLTEDRKERERVYQELKRQVDRERGIASKSVMRQINVGELQGDVQVTEMLFNLTLAGTSELPFKVTLRKYDLSEPGSDRVESARWVISDIEGATEEARAAAEAAREKESGIQAAEASEPEEEPEMASAEPPPSAAASPEPEAAPPPAPARAESTYLPKELRGLARVQILQPESRVEGNTVITTIRARNVSQDWITGFTVTEHWYDQQGNPVGLGSGTHRDRFMPGEVIELEVHTEKGSNFYQNQFEFTHANGKVNATVVGSFPDHA